MINSMVIIEAILITMLICTCAYVTVTDIRNGIIQNKVLLIAGALGLIANAVYYGIFARDYVTAYILNIVTMAAISIAFYALHIWAAGDSKLLMLTVFLIPAHVYYRGNNVTAAVVIMIVIFSVAYLYIIGESIYLGIKNKNFFKIGIAKLDIKYMGKQYVKCTCLVTIFYLAVSMILPRFYENNTELIMILNMIIILLSYNIKFLDRIIPLALLVIVTIAGYLLINGAAYNVDWQIYLLVLAVLLIRLCIEKYNYQTIPTGEVEKGMVMSCATTAYFIPSSVKGLPKEKNTEDIRSRITEEEAESIRRWENSKYGRHEIVIVRKIPFAIFISLGTVIYTFARMLIR